MRHLLPLSIMLLSTTALAQSQGAIVSPVTTPNAPPVSVAAINQAMSAKVDVLNGYLTNPTITGATISGSTLTNLNLANATLASPTINGGNLSGAMSTAAGGTTARTDAERFGASPEPQDFLSPGQTVAQLTSGAIDAAPAFSAAMAAGKIVHPPCGDYAIMTPIAVTGKLGAGIVGQGRWCVTLHDKMTTGNMITATSTSSFMLRDLMIQNDAVRTAGSEIVIAAAYDTDIEHIMLQDGALGSPATSGTGFSGIALVGSNTTRLNDISGRGGAPGDGIQITGYSVDTFLTNLSMNAWLHGVAIDNASGVYGGNWSILSSSSHGIEVNPPSGSNVNGVFLTNVLSDSNQGSGWDFEGVGPITEVKLTNDWGSGNGTNSAGGFKNAANGFYINNPKIDNLSISASEAHTNTANGIEVDAGTHILLENNTLLMNNSSLPASGSGSESPTSAVGAGIFVEAPATFVTVLGNYSGTGGYSAQNLSRPNEQAYGYLFASGCSTSNDIFSLNTSQGNTAAASSAPATTGSTFVNTGNIGS